MSMTTSPATSSELLELALRAEKAAKADEHAIMMEAWHAINGASLHARALTLDRLDDWVYAKRLFERKFEANAPFDAAISLIPKGCEWTFDSHFNLARVSKYYFVDGYGPDWQNSSGEAITPALALTAAALRASATQEPRDGECQP